MKKLVLATIVAVVAYQLSADILVNDTWKDGTRTDPAAPIYSENGVDSDNDGDLESAWFRGGSGSMSVVDIGGGVYVLRTTVGTSSASWTTYFGPVQLNDIGNKLTLTWVFTPYNVNVGNSSQGFRMAIFDSSTWLTTDGTPANQDFYGYAVFQNFATVLNRGNNDNLDIMERTTRNGDLLSTGANWTKRVGAGTQGNEGFLSGTEYTFVFSAERLASGLQLTASFSGGNIDGSGTLIANYLDDSPDTYKFSGFCIRPSMSNSAADQFDTKLFRVEYIPEPSTMAVLGLIAAGLLIGTRRVKS